MAEAIINESCIIGLPTCGYAFSSSRMAFIAAPSDDEFQLELDVLKNLLQDKNYEAFIALRELEPGKLAFCTKICSKIITSQFCIVLLNASAHKSDPKILIPNPNVHLEYGLMLAFKKRILPFQREGNAPLAFNISPLDTIMYSNKEFKQKAERAIDAVILEVGRVNRSTEPIAQSELLMKYLNVRRLFLTNVSTGDAAALYRIGQPLGYALVDNPSEAVYLGPFQNETAKEIVFRVSSLIRSLGELMLSVENRTATGDLSGQQTDRYRDLWKRIRIEVLVSKDIDRNQVEGASRN
jgi:hypothetical protein